MSEDIYSIALCCCRRNFSKDGNGSRLYTVVLSLLISDDINDINDINDISEFH